MEGIQVNVKSFFAEQRSYDQSSCSVDLYTTYSLEELVSKGWIDSVEAEIAQMVYIDLCESQSWYDVHLHYSAELGRTFITGKSSQSNPISTVVPLVISRQLTPTTMATFFTLRPGDDGSIILAFGEADTTIVYYELWNGIIDLERSDQEIN